MLKYTIHKSDYCSVLLNLCAVYSSMSNHQTAVKKAQEAISIALELILNSKIEEEEARQLITLICMGYYNLAAELQFLGVSSAACECLMLAKLIHGFVIEMIGGMIDGKFHLMVNNAVEIECGINCEEEVRKKYMRL